MRSQNSLPATSAGLIMVRQATEFECSMMQNPAHGMIILPMGQGPEHADEGQTLNKDPIIPLKHLSEIMYLIWEKQRQDTRSPISSLKYYMAPQIENFVTRNAARELVGDYLQTKLPEWSDTVVTEHEHPGQLKAMLETPMDAALGRLLASLKSDPYCQQHLENANASR